MLLQLQVCCKQAIQWPFSGERQAWGAVAQQATGHSGTLPFALSSSPTHHSRAAMSAAPARSLEDRVQAVVAAVTGSQHAPASPAAGAADLGAAQAFWSAVQGTGGASEAAAVRLPSLQRSK